MCVCLESIEKSGKTPEENGAEEKGENTRFFSICIPLYSSSSFVPSGRSPFLLQVRLPALPAQAPRRCRRGQWPPRGGWGPRPGQAGSSSPRLLLGTAWKRDMMDASTAASQRGRVADSAAY